MSETGENIFNRAKEVREGLESEEAEKKDNIIDADERSEAKGEQKEQEPIIIADGKTDLEKRTDEVSEKIEKGDEDIDNIIIA